MTAYLLNILDLIFTLYALSHGAVELNPLMGCVPFMIFYKVFVVGALLWWLNQQNTPVSRIGRSAITIVFAVVNMWHIVNMYFILKG